MLNTHCVGIRLRKHNRKYWSRFELLGRTIRERNTEKVILEEKLKKEREKEEKQNKTKNPKH